MSLDYTYVRNKKKLIIFNGMFDPCQNPVQMAAKHEITYRVGTITWSQPIAPGGAGDYAHKLTGIINTTRDTVEDKYLGQISSYRGNISNKQTAFPLYSPLKWKMRSEFRLYIGADSGCSEANYKLATSAVFCLDGATATDYTVIGFPTGKSYHLNRIHVAFNVTEQLAGITSSEKFDLLIKNRSDNKTIYSTAWAGSLNTWYDIRIEWEYDFYTNPLIIPVTVYVNKTQLFQYNVPINNWRVIENTGVTLNHQKNCYNANLGRPGFGINTYGRTTTTAGTVTAYFKDLFITVNDIRSPIYWRIEAGIIIPSSSSTASATYISSDTRSLCKGSDLQFWFRNSITDLWYGFWRGKVKETSRSRKKLVVVEAEGYGSLFALEKMENIALTTKTAAQIFVEAVNNPEKFALFDSSTYFDSVSNTYTRDYKQVPKIDIMLEMASLESFIIFLDIDNNFHFQGPRTNQTGIHLIYGQSKIFQYNLNHIDIRIPNIIRVIGSGVIGEIEILGRYFENETRVVSTINRADLVTQAEVDSAADYYASLYREDVQVLEIGVKNNWEIIYGSIITITIPNLNLQSTKFLVLNIQVQHTGFMLVKLLEVKPNLSLILSDLVKRSDRTESTNYESDTATQDIMNLEDVATLLVSATYEIEYNAEVVRSGNLTITDEFIDDLLEKWNNDSPTKPSHIAWGDDNTTEPTYEDTALVSEQDRQAAVLTYKDMIENYTSYNKYRSVEYSYVFTGSNDTIKEIGLFNAASSGTLAARAICTSYNWTGSLTVKIRLTFDTLSGSTYVTYKGLTSMADWLYAGSWSNIINILLAGESMYSSPNPQVTNLTEAIETNRFSWDGEEGTASNTFTKTLLKLRDEIKFEVTGSYEPEGTPPALPSKPEQGIVLSDSVSPDGNVSTKEYQIVGLRQTPKVLPYYHGYSFTYRIWLKILRSEITYN